MPEKTQPPTEPAGEKKTLKAAVLGARANLLQDVTPMKQFDIYVVGVHCGKPDSSSPLCDAMPGSEHCAPMRVTRHLS
jgi:hypothetical protein